MNATTITASYQVLDVGSAESTLRSLASMARVHDRMVQNPALAIDRRVHHAKVREKIRADAAAISVALRKKDRSFSRFMKRAMKPVEL